MVRGVLVLLLALQGFSAQASLPQLKITPLGKPDAPVAGTFTRSLRQEPENFSPLSGHEYSARQVFEYVVQGLLWLNPDTLEFEPQLAENYEISKDFLTITFFLRKAAHWSDGQPVTAEDVKFSIECVRDPAYKATFRAPFYDDVASVEVVDPATVRVKMKKKYYQNLEVLSTVGFTPILPKHIYGDPKRKWDTAPIVGSGPYKVEAYNRGSNIILVRDKNWWGNDVADQKPFGKFEHVNFRFVEDENLALEMIKKGQIDYIGPVQIENFQKKAVGEPFGTLIQKVEAENKIPKGWGFIGWNFKNPLFKDRNVRVALAHLLNRKLLLEKFMYGFGVEAVGPYYFRSPYLPAGAKPIEFDPEAAKTLLKKAGWADNDKSGVLKKTIDGKPTEFRFTLLLTVRDYEKYFTIYKEDLKKAGIVMDIKLIEWNTFSKLLDEQKFDAVTMSWYGGSIEEDLKQIWHSESSKPGGSNFISYSNKQVDKFIDQAREEMNAKKRQALWQKAAKLIIDDEPYAFLFNLKYDLFLLNKRIGYDKPTYTYDYSDKYWYLAK